MKVYRAAYRTPEAHLNRFFNRVEFLPGGCWQWHGCILKPSMYGQFSPGRGIKALAHRWIFEKVNGLVPAGLVLDHICRNRSCVNPDHVEPVTQRENVMRGQGLARYNAEKERCHRGHPLTEDNVYLHPAGFRRCRTCARAKWRD